MRAIGRQPPQAVTAPPRHQHAAAHAPQIVVSNFEETLPKDSVTAAEYALATATHKALDVATNLLPAAGGPPADLVIGADTVVE